MTIDIGGNDSTDARRKAPRFEKPVLVLVEGRDDQSLLDAIVSRLGVTESIEIFELRGKSDWSTKVRTIVENAQFAAGNVRALGLVRDVDQDAEASWRSCIDVLSSVGFPLPEAPVTLAAGDLASAVLLVPDEHSEGAIEELWLRAVDSEWIDCIGNYLACVESLSPGERSSKNMLKAFLAGVRRPPPTLGVAFEMGAVDRDHPTFDQAKTFLLNLAAHTRDADRMQEEPLGESNRNA